MDNETLKANAKAAFERWETSVDGVKEAKQALDQARLDVASTSPQAAIAAGKSLATAAAEHAQAVDQLAFYTEAVSAAEAWQAEKRNEMVLAAAERDHRADWNAAIDKRIAAAGAAEAATKALEQAIANYASATDAILRAHNSGIPRLPNHEALWLPLGKMKTEAAERAHWGRPA